MSTEPLTALSVRIKAYVTDRGHDWNIVAAASMVASSDLLLVKVGDFVDDDGWIEWSTLAEHVDKSGWSSGEKAALRLACSLAGYTPDVLTRSWSLASMLGPLDGELSRLAIEAVRYAVAGPEVTR